MKIRKAFPRATAHPGVRLVIIGSLAAQPKPVLAMSGLLGWVVASMSTAAWSGVVCFSKTAPPPHACHFDVLETGHYILGDLALSARAQGVSVTLDL